MLTSGVSHHKGIRYKEKNQYWPGLAVDTPPTIQNNLN